MKRRADHEPATLEGHARRLERFALDSPREVARELLGTADLLRRLADDLRLVDRFLRDAGLLAEDDERCHART